MAKRKPGDWWDRSWSVVTGCSWPEGERPPACENCWAEALARRFPAAHHQHIEMDADGGVLAPTDFGNVVTHPDRLDLPLRTKKPTIWAVSLLGDLFHPEVGELFIRKAFWAAEFCTQHKFVFITKRWNRAAMEVIDWMEHEREKDNYTGPFNGILLASVWDQASTDAACSAFAGLPVKWGLHMEPLLGPVYLTLTSEPWHCSGCEIAGQDEYGDIVADCRGHEPIMPSWIVVGGETGPQARPCHPDWVRRIRDQCKAAGVPFWFKGWGAWAPKSATLQFVGRRHDWGDGKYASSRASKKETGRILDGAEHNGVPW